MELIAFQILRMHTLPAVHTYFKAQCLPVSSSAIHGEFGQQRFTLHIGIDFKSCSRKMVLPGAINTPALIFTPRAHARARGYVIGRGVYI